MILSFKDHFSLFFLWVVFCLFVVYGSLLPFNYQPMSFDKALEQFLDMPYLDIGMEGRQDWVANLVLYIPVSFGAAMFFVPSSRLFFLRALGLAVVLSFSIFLAVGVEFLQVYFPCRTVSQNDLIAEAAGSLLGVLVYMTWGKKLAGIWHDITSSGTAALKGLLIFYFLGYFAYVLFPYDFLISGSEIMSKLASSQYAWFLVSEQKLHGHELYGYLKLVAEIVFFMPVGVLFAVMNPHRRFDMVSIAVLGLFAGFSIEVMQFFIASGISQGLSILLTMTGFVLGHTSWNWISGYDQVRVRVSTIRLVCLIVLLIYCGMLMVVNWYGRGPVIPVEAVVEKMGQLVYIPFFYHYRVSESVALFSAAAYFIMYVPAGVLCGLFFVSQKPIKPVFSIVLSLLSVGFLSFGFEFAKFFLSLAKPDFTNVLLGGLGSLLGCLLVLWARDLLRHKLIVL